MSSVVFSVSPRLAAVTAATRVDSAGLLLAAVATGSSVIPVKLPSPSAGTAEQPAPKGSSVIGSALGSLVSISALLVSAAALVSAGSSEPPQALRVMARVEAAVMRTPRVRRLFFTGWCSLSCPCDRIVAGGWCAGRDRGPESRRRRVPGRVCGRPRGRGGWSCGDHLDGVPAGGARGEG